MGDSYGIHWFRRDLRVRGNPALSWSRREHRGRVLGLFAIDPKFLERDDFSPERFAFFLATLDELRRELRENGGDLLVLDRGPAAALAELLQALSEAGAAPPATFSFNRDYEPFARVRDRGMEALLASKGIAVHTERDHLLLEPDEIAKPSDGGFYQVFTPYSRAWLRAFATSRIRERVAARADGPKLALTWHMLFRGAKVPADQLERITRENAKRVTIPLPSAGAGAAVKALRKFKARLAEYPATRDFPAENGTSHLSLYLKNGSLTIGQVVDELGLKAESPFLRQLIWREFYYHVLFHRPDVETQEFLEKYRQLRWENDESLFSAWKEGRTGYPIVDAGMRQLRETGWMHNRVRMIVASFLTKDLLIDWRWGERWFMQRLLDGDLAANNGGWQWAASTGCDPQPWFRIFNPTLQGRRFDPDGDYIRRYVPELRALPAKVIHDPRKLEASGSYPAPIVNHAARAIKALSLYRK